MEAIMVRVRWMVRRDFREVLDIENLCFDYPWSESDLIESLRQRNCIGAVAESECGLIQGYCIYELFPSYITITSLAVHPDVQGQGIGSGIVNRIKDKLDYGKRVRIKTLVRESNFPAQMFFKSAGFIATEVVKGGYEETDEDGYLFQYVIDDMPIGVL